MSITIKTVSFVTFGDLVDGLSDLTINTIQDLISMTVTWGDADHTLIPCYRVADILAGIDDMEISEGKYQEFKTLRDRVLELDESVMIDLES